MLKIVTRRKQMFELKIKTQAILTFVIASCFFHCLEAECLRRNILGGNEGFMSFRKHNFDILEIQICLFKLILRLLCLTVTLT